MLERNEHAFAVMNVYPYTSGHLMVAPLRHEATLADLTRRRGGRGDGAGAGRQRRRDGGVPARRHQRRRQHRPGRGCGRPGPRARARAAAVGRRHQLHDRGRRGPGAARAAHARATRSSGPSGRPERPGRYRHRDAGRRRPRSPAIGCPTTRATSSPRTSTSPPTSGRTSSRPCERRRIPATMYLVLAVLVPARLAACRATAVCSAPRSSSPSIAAYHFACAWPLTIDQTEALLIASRTVGFPVGHSSAQLAWRGLRARPVWRILLYSADEPPSDARPGRSSTRSTAR